MKRIWLRSAIQPAIEELAAELQVDEAAVEKAKLLWKEHAHRFRGYPVEVVAAALLYITVREECGVSIWGACVSKLRERGFFNARELLGACVSKLSSGVLPPLDTSKTVESIIKEACSKLKLHDKPAVETFQRLKERFRAGTSPRTIAATCIYLAYRDHRPFTIHQKDIAGACGITPVALRIALKRFRLEE